MEDSSTALTCGVSCVCVQVATGLSQAWCLPPGCSSLCLCLPQGPSAGLSPLRKPGFLKCSSKWPGLLNTWLGSRRTLFLWHSMGLSSHRASPDQGRGAKAPLLNGEVPGTDWEERDHLEAPWALAVTLTSPTEIVLLLI